MKNRQTESNLARLAEALKVDESIDRLRFRANSYKIFVKLYGELLESIKQLKQKDEAELWTTRRKYLHLQGMSGLPFAQTEPDMKIALDYLKKEYPLIFEF
jgi:hypothetical protein